MPFSLIFGGVIIGVSSTFLGDFCERNNGEGNDWGMLRRIMPWMLSYSAEDTLAWWL